MTDRGVVTSEREIGNIENMCQCQCSVSVSYNVSVSAVCVLQCQCSVCAFAAKYLVSRIASGNISAAASVLIDRTRQSDCSHRGSFQSSDLQISQSGDFSRMWVGDVANIG